MKVHLVVLELLGRVNEGLVPALLLFFKLLDLLLNSVVGKLGEEHLLFLVDEFIGVLSTLLLGELDAASSNMHGSVNVILLLQVIVGFSFLIVTIGGRNITVLDSV